MRWNYNKKSSNLELNYMICIPQQPPNEAKPWNGVRDATQIPPMCVQPKQFNIINSPITGQEDCLYLNVFVPTVSI